MPQAHDTTVPASRLEALRTRRARIDDELQSDLQHLSVSDFDLKEKKKLKLLLRDTEESIRATS